MRTMKRRRSIRRFRSASRPMVYANPPRRRKRVASAARKSRHHSPAMRAKISRAVKAAMRRRSSGGAVTARRSVRRRRPSFAVARRRSYSAPARRSNRIVMGRLLNPNGRRSRRRAFRRRNPGIGIASIKGLLSKDVVHIAAGAITASVGTGFVLNRFGSMLPGANTQYGRIAYQMAIPLSAAYLLRNKARSFSTGLAVGAVVMAITTVMKSGIMGAGVSSVVQGPMGNFYEVKGMGLAGEIGSRRPVRGLNAYIGPKTYHTIPDAVNSPVFQGGAWS